MPRPPSAGILLFRRAAAEIEVLLVKPGGPFFGKKKDVGAWMIPKGMVEPGETSVEAAMREFEEEIGVRLEVEPFPLRRVRQAGGKIVEVFATEGDLDVSAIKSTQFEMEWPPRSGSMRSYPEVSEGRWMRLDEARRLILPSQLPILDALSGKLDT